MKLTLTYDGELPASGNSSKPANVWDIRRKIHPQLEWLWKSHPELRNVSLFSVIQKSGGGMGWTEPAPGVEYPPRDWLQSRLPKGEGSDAYLELTAPIERHGCLCVPLVRPSLYLSCGLDILFLRGRNPARSFSPEISIIVSRHSLMGCGFQDTPRRFVGNQTYQDLCSAC